MQLSKIQKKTIIVLALLSLTACGGSKTVKAPVEEKPPIKAEEAEEKKGAYYKDDGPEETVPDDLVNVPDAIPKHEPYSSRANKPYTALEQRYTPMTSYEPYKVQGMASWYGKRYHGGKTSTGETYDMYGMTAAHKTLPIPSYARVTNVNNGKSVVVRINDRGPFINGRIVDLSYVAAHKLGMVEAGQTEVEVEAIDTSEAALEATAVPVKPEDVNAEILPKESMPAPVVEHNIPDTPVAKPTMVDGFYVQVGAFKSEQNGLKLIERLSGFGATDAVTTSQKESGGIYRVKVGPYATRTAAQEAVDQLEAQYQIKGIIQK